jgi:hypothetical protein
MLRAGTFALLVFATLLVSRRLSAESARVVLVHWQPASGIVAEAITRIRGELVADGFEVSVVGARAGEDPASVLALADPRTTAAATLGLFLQPDARAAELWVIDRLTSKTVVRRIEMTEPLPGAAPEVLARRSVELLRASLLEILVDTREGILASPSAPREKASSWAARSLEPRRSRWGAEAGVQVLAGFGGVGSAVMPVGRVRIALARRLAGRMSLSGLGTRPRVDAASGSATVSQELGLLELVGEVAPNAWLSPELSLGAGVYHVGITGTGSSPYAGLRGDRLVFATDAGAGVVLSVTSSLALSLEGHGILLTPYPVIRFLGVETARIGNPLMSVALTLRAQL